MSECDAAASSYSCLLRRITMLSLGKKTRAPRAKSIAADDVTDHMRRDIGLADGRPTVAALRRAAGLGHSDP